jgi:uncharacterized protein (TIGR04376 family)
MGLFEDLSSFLETRLEEFIRNNPHLELQALEENLREQEEEALNLLADLKRREKTLQDEILATAQEIQRWHVRIEKAKAAQRFDLVKPAEEREAALLRQGNQLWGQMEMLKQRTQQTIELQQQIQIRKREVKAKVAEAQANRAQTQAGTASQTEQQWQTTGWNQASAYGVGAAKATDPLEQTFQRWETDEELEDLKRQMNR